MLRVVEIPGDGPAHEVSGDDHVGPPPAGSLRWVDVSKPRPEELELLRRRFDFHPLAIEDCATFGQRPKLEQYRDHVFVVIHRVSCGSERPFSVSGQELHAFLGPDYLVTVHEEQLPELEELWRSVVSDPAHTARGTAFIYYLLADRIVDTNFDLLDQVSGAIEDVEDAVLRQDGVDAMPLLFALKRSLAESRRMLSPQRDVFATLAKGIDSIVEERTAVYFRNVYDHLIRISEAVDTNRDLLGNVLDAHLSMASNRTNEIMKSLTLLSAIFLPLTFVTGFFGQNFAHLPFGSRGLMWATILSCLVIPGAMLLWFRSRRWM